MHTAEALRERTLLFPDEPGLGVVWVPSTVHRGGWESRGRAQGRVAIDPPHQKVRVELTEKAATRAGGLSFVLSWDPFAVQELHLEGGSIDDDTVAVVAHLPGLEVLHLKGTHVTARGLRSLDSLSRLTTLTLIGCPVQDDVFAVACQFPWLERLWLTDCPVTGQGLSELARLPRLRSLGLTKAPLEEHHLRHLSALVGLQELGCFETALTDATLTHLYALPRLETLKAAQVRFTTRGLLELKRRLPLLRDIELRTMVGTRTTSVLHGASRSPWPGWSQYIETPDAVSPPAAVAVPAPLPLEDCISNVDVARSALPGAALQESLRHGCALLGQAGTARLDLFYETQYKQRLAALITSDILVGLLPVFVAELRFATAAALYDDLESLVQGMLLTVQGPARTALLVADRLLKADSLRPRVEALLHRIALFKTDNHVTTNGRPYQNWPAREHQDEWWKLIRDERELFDELKLEKSWPSRRDTVLQAVQRYLERPRAETEADPQADAELSRIAAAIPARCELTGRMLDYARVAETSAHSQKLRKYDQVVHWFQALEWPPQHEAPASMAAAARLKPARERWERIFMLESLLSDASGPTLLHSPPGDGLFGRRVNPWLSADPITSAEAGNFPQVWGWMLQGLLEDANAADAPAFMRTPLWRNKMAATIMSGVLLAGHTPSRPALHLDEPAGSDRNGLEAWVEPVPRFLSRLDAWMRTVQVALNAMDLSSFDLNVRLNRLNGQLGTLRAAVAHQQAGGCHSVETCHELTGLPHEMTSTLSLSPRSEADAFQVAVGPVGASQQRLALGLWQRVVAACPMPDGTSLLAAGAVLPVFQIPADWTLDRWSTQQAQDPQSADVRPWQPPHG